LETRDPDIRAGFMVAASAGVSFWDDGEIRRFRHNFMRQSRIIIGLSHLSRTTVSLT
jgi:hypothetical protein